MYTLIRQEQSCLMNCAFKMSLIPSKYDLRFATMKFLDFYWLSGLQTIPTAAEVYPLSKSVDLSTDPGLMSYLITCTCSE
jgi:hypothetical protein